jgi:hypothetical protein
MKTGKLSPRSTTQYFFDFVKLGKNQQNTLLKSKGILLDLHSEKTTCTELYSLSGFFVERITSLNKQDVIDIIPYKQGYRAGNYLTRIQSLN